MVTAAARVRGLTVVTRNMADFKPLAVEVLNLLARPMGWH